VSYFFFLNVDLYESYISINFFT